MVTLLTLIILFVFLVDGRRWNDAAPRQAKGGAQIMLPKGKNSAQSSFSQVRPSAVAERP
jgi:hypothetical protein